jgi:HSP20 family protein
MDVVQTDKNYVITCDLPGFDRENIRVSVEDELLTVKASRKDSREQNNQYVMQERTFGKVTQSVRVENMDPNAEILARYENGVLTILVPLAQPHTPAARVINVQ